MGCITDVLWKNCNLRSTLSHRKWEMLAVLDVLGGWVGFSSLFKLLMKFDNLSLLFLKVFVVSVGQKR